LIQLVMLAPSPHCTCGTGFLQFVLLVNLSKVSSLLCKLKPVLTFDKLLWREGCPKIALILSSPRASRASQPSLGCARALAELNLRPGLSMCQDRGEFRQAAGVADKALSMPARRFPPPWSIEAATLTHGAGINPPANFLSNKTCSEGIARRIVLTRLICTRCRADVKSVLRCRTCGALCPTSEIGAAMLSSGAFAFYLLVSVVVAIFWF
jgi:hypothetical protein